MSRPDSRELVSTEHLEQTFRAMYPRATDQEIAALMAAFLEEVPAHAVLDDGGLAPADAIEDSWAEMVDAWIGKLKEFAGDAYPPEKLRGGRM